MTKRWLILFVTLFWLSACARTAAPPTATFPAPMLPPMTVTPSVPLAEDVLAIYHKTGGIAGLDETLTVHQGGLLELTDRSGTTRTLTVDEPVIQPLRRMLAQNDFSALQPVYQAAGADLFVYTITARDANGNPKSVTTMDGAQHPPYLSQLITTLNQLRAAIR